MGEWKQEPTLARWKGEVEMIHRAMLLWVMQHDGNDHNLSRSKRAVAKAVGRADATIRDWHRTHRWDDRAASVPDSCTAAVAMYRELYLQDYGAAELPVVANRVLVPLSLKPGAPMGTDADEVISSARREAGAVLRVEQAVVQGAAERRKLERDKVERHRKLVDFTIGEFADQLKNKKIRLTARDLPALLVARNHLTEWLTAHDDRHIETKTAVESARLKYARDTNGDLLEAMWLDLQELQVVLGALRTRRDDSGALEAQVAYAADVALVQSAAAVQRPDVMDADEVADLA